MGILVVFEWVMVIAFALLQIVVVIMKFKAFVTKMSTAEKERYNNHISDMYFSLTILLGLFAVLVTILSFIVTKLYNQIPIGV